MSSMTRIFYIITSKASFIFFNFFIFIFLLFFFCQKIIKEFQKFNTKQKLYYNKSNNIYKILSSEIAKSIGGFKDLAACPQQERAPLMH